MVRSIAIAETSRMHKASVRCVSNHEGGHLNIHVPSVSTVTLRLV